MRGGTTHAEVAEGASAYPALATLAGQIGDPAVRNRGTIGGSLTNNDPAACYPAAALASGATIVTNAREIAADDYFQGMFTTALEEIEIITEVAFRCPRWRTIEVPATGVALCHGWGLCREVCGWLRVAVTGASEEGVFRWAEAEAALSANFSADAVSGLTVEAEGMIGDIHGTKEYRAHLVGVMTKRAVTAALTRRSRFKK